MTYRWAMLACALWLPTAAFARTWTDDTGTFWAEGELVGVEDGRVILKRTGGVVVRIPLERLSKADHDFLDKSGALAPDTSDPALPKGVDAAAIQKAETEVKEVIKGDLAAAKTPAQREKLVAKLLQMASDSRGDKASQFVLYRKAAEMAAALGKANLVLAAMDDLEAMVKDPLPAWNQVAAALDTHHPIQESGLLVDKFRELFDLAIGNDDFDSAGKLGNVILNLGRLNKDLGLQASARAKIADAAAAKEELKRIAGAKEQLKQNPADEDANRQMGRFLCLFKGDFDHGLPLLAVSNDKTLKPIAIADLKKSKSVADMLFVGDSWLTASKNVASRTAAQERGIYWLRQARPLSDSATRVRIDGKLSPFRLHDWIDLVAKVEFPRDQLGGGGYWAKEGSMLTSANPNLAVMKFPLVLERPDYELAVDFMRVSGEGGVAILFPVGNHTAAIVFNAHNDGRRIAADGLEMVSGKLADDNPTTIRPSLLRTGQHIPLRIAVDVAGDDAEINAFIDRQRIIAWKGKIAALDPNGGWGFNNQKGLAGIAHRSCSIIVQSAKLLPK